jgi:hypothetical protein
VKSRGRSWELEAQIALEALTRRFPRLRLVEGQELCFHPNISFRGPQALCPEPKAMSRIRHVGAGRLTRGRSGPACVSSLRASVGGCRPLNRRVVSWRRQMSRFEELAGLPGTGPWPEQFSPTGQGTHTEGFVVRFVPNHGKSWIGNFQPGLTSFRGVYRHPNDHHLLVVSGGQGYLVDPETRALFQVLEGAIASVHVCAKQQLLILDHQGIAFEAIGRTGRAWHTRRLSWDGFRGVDIGETEIVGEGWNAIDQQWQPFRSTCVWGGRGAVPTIGKTQTHGNSWGRNACPANPRFQRTALARRR